MMNLNNTQLKDVIDPVINIIGVSIPALITYMAHYIMSDKNWRNRKGKSSFDKYTILQCKASIFLFLSIIVIEFLFLFIISFMGFEVNNDVSKKILGVSIIISILFYLFYIRNQLDGVINIKKKYKKKYKKKNVKGIAYIVCYIQFIMTVIVSFSTMFFKENLVFKICFLLICFCVILEAIILEDVSDFEKKYISFTCKDGWKLDGVLNKDVYKKGNWMIAKLNSGKEVRFKYEDIIRIEYSNKLKAKKINI